MPKQIRRAAVTNMTRKNNNRTENKNTRSNARKALWDIIDKATGIVIVTSPTPCTEAGARKVLAAACKDGKLPSAPENYDIKLHASPLKGED